MLLFHAVGSMLSCYVRTGLNKVFLDGRMKKKLYVGMHVKTIRFLTCVQTTIVNAIKVLQGRRIPMWSVL